MTSCYTDNAQSSVSQPNTIINKHTTVVGAAMFDHIAHPFEHIAVNLTS